MARPQNSSRGLFAKKRVDVPVSGGMMFEDYSTSSDLLTASGTGLKLAGGLAISGKTSYITENSTGFAFPTVAAKPSARSAAKWTFLTDSTGRNAILVNTTGTTWKFLNVTSVIPT